MIRFSEFVSLGHPDKIADYISEYILDRYMEKDPYTRYAVEVQIKNYYVTLGGEVSSKHYFSPLEISRFTREAVDEIGYTKEYQDKWGAKNTICGDDLIVASHISQQSPDITRGLKGWGDQGIFFGYAENNPETCYMPTDHDLAKRLCWSLFYSGLGGLDIKTQVVMKDARVEKVIVAIPLLEQRSKRNIRQVREFVREIIPGDCKVIVNGTGVYQIHSSIADCGTTGRKLVVDFYGGNSKIGGGSPWTKDGSKADLALNVVARHFAKRYARDLQTDCRVSLACCIGKPEVDMMAMDREGNIIIEREIILSPGEIIDAYKLNTPIYASMCRWGLFGQYQIDKEWEK